MIWVVPPPQPEPDVPGSGEDIPVTWVASEPVSMAMIAVRSTAKLPAEDGRFGGGARLHPAAAADDEDAAEPPAAGTALAASDAFQSTWIRCLAVFSSLAQSAAGK